MKKPKPAKKVATHAETSKPKKKKPGPKPKEPFRLNDQQRREIDKAKNRTHDSRLHAGLLALTWLDRGMSELEVAELLDCHRDDGEVSCSSEARARSSWVSKSVWSLEVRLPVRKTRKDG